MYLIKIKSDMTLEFYQEITNKLINFVYSRGDEKNKNVTVEKYYNLTTSNTDYASLTTTSKDYYLNEMYTALRADNPKILKLASTALNTV